jgi:response regulator RpfG family c-di-GMP phosphodiesterase
VSGTSLPSSILAQLGILALERGSDGFFTRIGPDHEWFRHLFPDLAADGPLTFEDSMPFLANFVVDAEEWWREGSGEHLVSGPWVETDDEGREWPLEATALRVGDRHVLLIRHLGLSYTDTQLVLQRAREFNLDNELLEQLVQERTATIREREEEIVLRLATAAEFRDQETGAHVRRIGRLSTRLAAATDANRQLQSDMALAAAMHDIGKIGIPDEILLKPGPLTPEERSVMQTHTTIGARILEGSEAPVLELAQEIALAHHERWDGTGYPNKLTAEDIPLSARIVAVVDCYDALVTSRVYRAALSRNEALMWLVSHRGTHFDRDVLDAFLEIESEMREYY